MVVMEQCPRCGAEAREDQRFCADCGLDLRRQPSPGKDALLGLAALAGVGLATVGLQVLLDKLLGWPERRKGEE
jgi:hypothetical protein